MVCDPKKVAHARKLLADGLSGRQAAIAAGLSRSTVANIANGTRPDYEALGLVLGDAGPSGPLVRCDGCGGSKVQMPCQLCLARARKALRAAEGRESRVEGPAADTGLDLSKCPADVRVRYEAVHAAKVAANEEQVAWNEPVGQSTG